MDEDEKFLWLAIEEGNKQKPPRNFGALIVKNGQIIGAGHNHVHKDNDPSAHAEITAIREAAQHVGSKDLSGCAMYGSHEPCFMCFTCAGWANIDRVVYANPASKSGDSYEFQGVTLQELAGKFTRKKISIEPKRLT